MAPVSTSPTPAIAALPPPGRYGWCWLATLAALREDGAVVARPDAPAPDSDATVEFVVGAAAHAVVATQPPPRGLTWLLTDAADLAACSERHLAACARILSPMRPNELRWPDNLPASVRAKAREKLHFLELELSAAFERPAAFTLSHLAVSEPFPLVVWQVAWHCAAPDAVDVLQLQQAILAARAPAGCWLLPPPISALELEVLERLAPAGTQLVRCPNLRAGAQEAIRRRGLASPARPKIVRRELVLRPGVIVRCSEPTAAEMDALCPSFAPCAERTTSGNFARALADWRAGRSSIVKLAHAFVDSGHWRQLGGVAALRENLLIESPATPAAFFANALGRLPLASLYETPTDRTLAVARFGRELLSDSPANVALHRLADALLGDRVAFDGRARPSALPAWLATVAVAWLTRLEWQPGPMPELPVHGPELPAELMLGAAAALASSGRWSDALALAQLAQRSHPDLFERSRNEGRWNRHLLWAVLCRRWGDSAQAEAALAWARATDASIAEQLFLFSRTTTGNAGCLPPLPDFSAPWRLAASPTLVS